MILYRLLDIRKVYQQRTVLDISSLEIEAGKIYALLGPNGAGKTTLLNILAFLDAPSRGDVSFQSRPVRYAETVLQELRKKVVMVDQHPIMFTASVYSNVEFGLKIRGVPKRRRERIVAESLDLVGMRQFESAPAHRLSGGETQRVALARALALSPEVFLCDEPTSGIDAENREVVVDILRQINTEKQISLIFTTHDRMQASGLTQRILALEGGRLAATAYENVFAGEVVKHGDSTCRFHIRNGISIDVTEIQANQHQHRHRHHVKIFIDPAAVKLMPHSGKGHPNKNIDARVVSAAVENDHIRIVVDAGVSVTAFIPEVEYRAMQIMVGDSVQLQVPPESIQFL